MGNSTLSSTKSPIMAGNATVTISTTTPTAISRITAG